MVYDRLRNAQCGGKALAVWAVQKPAVGSGPAPKHPRSLKQQGGSVTVQFIVGANGQVDPATVKVTAATNSGFVDAVQECCCPSGNSRPPS